MSKTEHFEAAARMVESFKLQVDWTQVIEEVRLQIAAAVNAAVAEEREACAKIAERKDPLWAPELGGRHAFDVAGRAKSDEIAAAIRNRKET